MCTYKVEYFRARNTEKENQPTKATPLFSTPPDPAECCLMLRLSDTEALSLIARLRNSPDPEPFVIEICRGLQAALGKPVTAYEADGGKV